MKSFQPTFPWADNTNTDNIAKLIHTLGDTDTDVVIRLEDAEGLREALQLLQKSEGLFSINEDLTVEVEELESEIRGLEDESSYQESRISSLERQNEELQRKLDELESGNEF